MGDVYDALKLGQQEDFAGFSESTRRIYAGEAAKGLEEFMQYTFDHLTSLEHSVDRLATLMDELAERLSDSQEGG